MHPKHLTPTNTTSLNYAPHQHRTFSMQQLRQNRWTEKLTNTCPNHVRNHLSVKVKGAVPQWGLGGVLISEILAVKPVPWWTTESVSHGQCDARPTVTFPATEHHRPLAGTKLYCLVTEAHGCEQLAQSCYNRESNILTTESPRQPEKDGQAKLAWMAGLSAPVTQLAGSTNSNFIGQGHQLPTSQVAAVRQIPKLT